MTLRKVIERLSPISVLGYASWLFVATMTFLYALPQTSDWAVQEHLILSWNVFAIVLLLLLYRAWKELYRQRNLLPDHSGYRPGIMVGLCLIPFLGVFWSLYTFTKVFRQTNRLLKATEKEERFHCWYFLWVLMLWAADILCTPGILFDESDASSGMINWLLCGAMMLFELLLVRALNRIVIVVRNLNRQEER